MICFYYQCLATDVKSKVIAQLISSTQKTQQSMYECLPAAITRGCTRCCGRSNSSGLPRVPVVALELWVPWLACDY
eukprot:m.144908 g.144908  ORF g.144908 m.144908 type:complete len:76 (+) comp16209_c0_seq11:1815-2042(+)